jgi:hypothetical protein
MRDFLGLIVMVFILASTGCDSEETVTGEDPLARISDLRVELQCLGAGSADVNCIVPDSDEESTAINGDEGIAYDVTLRIRGVVEQKTYTDYVDSDGMWIEGGTPDGGSFNVFRLHVSSPDKTYYLNAGMSGIDECFLLDIQKTIVMDDGAVLTLLADAGGDGLATRNRDVYGDPIVVDGVSPYPYAFDGQFVQIDVIDVKVR